MFKAIELDPGSRRRTGREYALDAGTRQEAVDQLLRQLGIAPSDARIDPTRTIVQTERQLWTIVARRPAAPDEAPTLRRAGAKHKRVR